MPGDDLDTPEMRRLIRTLGTRPSRSAEAARAPQLEEIRALSVELAAAERVAEVFARMGIDSALIGALALAAHGYPRSTDDLNLAIGVEPRRLEEIARALRGEESRSTRNRGDLERQIDVVGGPGTGRAGVRDE